MVEDPNRRSSLGDGLLREETIDESRYKEYRMNLELALNRAERFERITFHVCWIALLWGIVLMFVGGTQVVGAFDPTDSRANPLSITLGVVYVVANITWPLALASLYSRFRPRIRNLKQQISDTKIDRLEDKIDQLQRELEQLRGRLGE